MSTINNAIDQVLQTAIQREIAAQELYQSAATMVEGAQAKELLVELAQQELGHQRRLESLRTGQVFKVLSREQAQQVVDLKITDYLIEEPLAPDSDFQTILIVAGKREKGSHDLYAALAQVADDDETAQLFQHLAAEELRHKQRVESLYEELVYQDN